MNDLSITSFKRFLEEKGIRQTRKRDLILEILFKKEGHLTIEELLEEAKKTDPKMGYVTVYRTLKLLKDCGLVQKLQFGDGQSRFERLSEHHDHLICLKCHRIIEFEESRIEEIQDEVARNNHFKIVSHVHEIYGYCSQCS